MKTFTLRYFLISNPYPISFGHPFPLNLHSIYLVFNLLRRRFLYSNISHQGLSFTFAPSCISSISTMSPMKACTKGYYLQYVMVAHPLPMRKGKDLNLSLGVILWLWESFRFVLQDCSLALSYMSFIAWIYATCTPFFSRILKKILLGPYVNLFPNL